MALNARIMNIAILTSIFFLAMVKFMFASIPGSIADIPAWQTYLAACSGGTISAAFFYFSAELFMKMSARKKLEKELLAIKNGKEIKQKKKFTYLNKMVVKLKRSVGIYGITFLAPLFLSVPIGSIISAKFYGKKKITFLLIVIGMFTNGLLTTGLAYIFR
jgi:ABC-type spermidine/putrescine transport system permease subunit I